MTLTKALMQMGYRRMDGSKRWGKPIGYMIYTVDLITDYKGVFNAWFKRADNGKPEVYESHAFDYIENKTDMPLDWLKYVECYARHDVNPHFSTGDVSEFEFLTLEQMVEINE